MSKLIKILILDLWDIFFQLINVIINEKNHQLLPLSLLTTAGPFFFQSSLNSRKRKVGPAVIPLWYSDVDTEYHLSGPGAVRKRYCSIFLCTYCAAEGSINIFFLQHNCILALASQRRCQLAHTGCFFRCSSRRRQTEKRVLLKVNQILCATPWGLMGSL